METPTPSSLTLFLKSHKVTTLLHAAETSSLPSLKTALHQLLHENAEHLTSLPALPETPDDIILGALTDPNGTDLSRGFYILQNQEKKKSTLKEAGLKDGAVLAWKLDGDEEGGFVVDVPREDGEGEEEEEEEEEEEGEQ